MADFVEKLRTWLGAGDADYAGGDAWADGGANLLQEHGEEVVDVINALVHLLGPNDVIRHDTTGGPLAYRIHDEAMYRGAVALKLLGIEIESSWVTEPLGVQDMLDQLANELEACVPIWDGDDCRNFLQTHVGAMVKALRSRVTREAYANVVRESISHLDRALRAEASLRVYMDKLPDHIDEKKVKAGTR